MTQIAGPTRFGQFQIANPCCNGDGAVNAGGVLVAVLVGGYRPPANKEFPIFQLFGGKFAGTFSRVRGGFSGGLQARNDDPGVRRHHLRQGHDVGTLPGCSVMKLS